MNKKVILLGAGPGGYVAAKLGAKVKIIEQDEVGGTKLLKSKKLPSGKKISILKRVESLAKETGKL